MNRSFYPGHSASLQESTTYRGGCWQDHAELESRKLPKDEYQLDRRHRVSPRKHRRRRFSIHIREKRARPFLPEYINRPRIFSNRNPYKHQPRRPEVVGEAPKVGGHVHKTFSQVRNLS